MNNDALYLQLVALLGVDNVSSPAGQWPLAWTERAAAVVAPASVEETTALVLRLEEASAALVPIGGGTQIATGYPPRVDKPFVLLSTRRLNRILDHQPEDMTVTVEPGVTLAQLQDALALRQQSLALDAPLPARATLGGLVSTNTSGLLRPAFGTPRDLLIGVKAVITEGVAVKGGGRVVKNVAGYDVCKLFTGAWGTLGVCTELTFKIRTQPPASRFVAWNAPDIATAARVGLQWHHAQLAPITIVVTNELTGRAQIVVGMEGAETRLAWQTEQFSHLAREAGLADISEDLTPAQMGAWQDKQARSESVAPFAARIACLPTELPALAAALEKLPDAACTLFPGVGTLALAADENSVLSVQNALPAGANCVWTRLPDAMLETTDVWSRSNGVLRLHQSLKQKLDPRSTFSPGRFYGRL